MTAGGAAEPAEHGEGGATVGLTQGSRYEHPEISAAIPAVSEGLFQPSPALAVGVAVEPLGGVNVGAGSVGIGPVSVYDGRRLTAPALLNVVGGQGKAFDTVAGMFPAPVPPVCQGFKGGCHGLLLPHAPMASRGSVGIHPWSKPS